METTTTPNPHAVNCKFCGGDFTPSRLPNHERDCEQKSPEQRKKASDARQQYRHKYSAAAKNGAGATAQRYVERIRAETNTPARRRRMSHEEAHQRKLERQRAYYKQHGRKRNDTREEILVKAVSKASLLLNGKRVQITLSLDWETVKRLIIAVAPDIAIDGITLI